MQQVLFIQIPQEHTLLEKFWIPRLSIFVQEEIRNMNMLWNIESSGFHDQKYSKYLHIIVV
jgi:hypothetical protein